jgi:RNA polymerase sigma factor (sigma-70 family)
MENLRIYRSALALDSFTIGELATHCGANVNTVRSLLTNRSRDLFEVVGHQPRQGRGRRSQLFRVRNRETMQELLRARQAPLRDGPGTDLTSRSATASGVVDRVRGPAERPVSVDATIAPIKAAVASLDDRGTDQTPQGATASGVVNGTEGLTKRSVLVDAATAGDHAAVALLDGPSNDQTPRERAAPEVIGLIARRAATGDEAAWRMLFDRFNRHLYWVCRTFRLSSSDADDVVQATWMQLYENIGRIRDPGQIGGWLATTARREALRVLRAQTRELATETLPDGPDYAELEVEVFTAERTAVLQRALASLPERHRQLLMLLASEPTPDYQELSAALAMPVGSIGPARARALARLRHHPELRDFHLETASSMPSEHDGPAPQQRQRRDEDDRSAKSPREAAATQELKTPPRPR